MSKAQSVKILLMVYLPVMITFLGCKRESISMHSETQVTHVAHVVLHKHSEFERTSRRVVTALKRHDWQAFKRLTASHIQISQYEVIYLQDSDLSAHLITELFLPVLFSGKYGRIRPSKSSLGVINTAGGLLSLCSVLVDMHHKPSPKTRYIFDKFCNLVAYTCTFPPDWITSGEDITALDEMPFTGPAINGKVASNEYWRVELDKIRGRWLITRLFVTLH